MNKKRKSEFCTDEKEAEKGQKKYKKSKDAFGEVREISMDACLGGKESMGQESNEVTFLENNFGYKAKRMRNKKSLKGCKRISVGPVLVITCKAEALLVVAKMIWKLSIFYGSRRHMGRC